MPLNRRGRKIKKAMQRTYGKSKGTRVFYAYENKHKGQVKRGNGRGR